MNTENVTNPELALDATCDAIIYAWKTPARGPKERLNA